jgi:HD-GYP domain-containing protein (c-di-GMP phosphodiesterase class II)
VFKTTAKSSPTNGVTGINDAAITSAWIALDRYIRELESGRQLLDRYSSALTTIRDSTNAQLAFIQTDGVSRAPEMVGEPTPSPRWCRELCHALAASLPRGGLWRPQGGDPARIELSSGPIPHSAAFLPVEPRKFSWLVALSFDPENALDEADFRVIQVVWRLQVHNNRNLRMYENLKETLFGIVRCLSTAIDAKDPYTCGHSERVARIAVRLGEEMGLSRGEINDLYLAGLLHDVGKIGIRDDVLLKPGPLTPAEFHHVREHPITGERIISNVTRLAYLRPAVRGHHERFDGAGYPDGLAGEGIPLIARILAVADSCDAMMSTRRYRLALAPAQIEAVFSQGSGVQWDPRVVKCFFACSHELYAVSERGLGHSVMMAVERAAGGASQIARASLPPADAIDAADHSQPAAIPAH